MQITFTSTDSAENLQIIKNLITSMLESTSRLFLVTSGPANPPVMAPGIQLSAQAVQAPQAIQGGGFATTEATKNTAPAPSAAPADKPKRAAKTAPAAAPAVTPAISQDAVRQLLIKAAQEGKEDRAKAILSSYGCTKLSQVPLDKLVELAGKVSAL